MASRYISLFTFLLFISSALGQEAMKDYTTAIDCNPWLATDNGASLTTFSDSVSAYSPDKCSVSKAGIYFRPLTLEAASVYRLSSRTVLSGRIAYSYDIDKDHTGTVFYEQGQAGLNTLLLSGGGAGGIRPFDIIISNPGKVTTEKTSLVGAIGWQATKQLSIGAKAEYTTASSARQKDLRYSNFRMDLGTTAGIFYSPRPNGFAGGVSLYYRRAIEALSFSRAGTTDAILTSFIDYANGVGITETFSGEGFTDDTEQPLFSQYLGVTAQVGAPLSRNISLFVDGLYAHRTGYYGKLSQYTIRHTQHKSDCYRLYIRLSFLRLGRVWKAAFLDAGINIENLTNHRNNYLSETIDGVTSYTYYAPTKTANKVQADGHISLISHLKNWRISLGSFFMHRKQTAWVYPTSTTETESTWTPFATVQ